MQKYSLLNQDINTSFLNIETTWVGMRSALLKKQVGLAVPDSFCELIKGETLNYFQNAKQAKIFSRTCAKKLLNNKKLLFTVGQKTDRLSKEVMKLARKIFFLSKMSDKEIIEYLTKSRNLQRDLSIWGMVVAFADIYGEISDQIIKIFSRQKKLKYPISYYLEILANPTEQSLTAKAYKEISLSKNDKFLQKKYFWLDQGYIGRGLNIKQLNNIRRHYKQEKIIKKSEQNKIAEKLNLSLIEKNILSVSAEMVRLKSLRSDSRQSLYTAVNKIVDLMAKRWKVSAKYLESLSIPELITTINNINNLEQNLASRWMRSVLIPKSADDYQVVTGNFIESYISNNVIADSEKMSESQEITGQVAHPGKIRGKVKLVFGAQHNSKVKKGDVLVSVSTSPQLLPAMKLAAAFVTDMGGITSHAAIVAREFRKPCVVGTKIATHILRDGDLVEVDANKGIVKIIKKK